MIPAYNRPELLREILRSIASSKVGSKVDLLISIDGSDPECLAISESAHWPFGERKIRAFPERQGLKAHILKCGDWGAEYDWFCMLEDDLDVSPHWWEFAVLGIEKYRDDPRIAGVALYSYSIDELSQMDFTRKLDGFDTHFIQFACSWGQCWTSEQWSRFRRWLETHDSEMFEDSRLPASVCEWPAGSWKKHFIRYLVDQDLFFAYPNCGLTSCPGFDGTNHKGLGALYEVPLLQGHKLWNLAAFPESDSKYDVFFRPISEGADAQERPPRPRAIRDKYGIGVIEAFAILRSAFRASLRRRWPRWFKPS